jgi:hypothetical protein
MLHWRIRAGGYVAYGHAGKDGKIQMMYKAFKMLEWMT